MIHRKTINEDQVHRSTVDYHFPRAANSNRNPTTILSAKEMELVNILGTTAKKHELPLFAYMSGANLPGEKIIWSVEGEENKITAQTKSGVQRVDMELTKYQTWPPKFNVEKNKIWKTIFNIPASSRLHLLDKIYVTDSHGNTVGQTFIVNGEGNRTTLSIKPNTDYIPGETYTLYIQSIEGENGEILQQSVKMDFTIEGR